MGMQSSKEVLREWSQTREHHLRTSKKHEFLSPISDPLSSEDGAWAICSSLSSAGESGALADWRATA